MSEPVIHTRDEMNRTALYAEIDRLRAENAELRRALQTLVTEWYRAGLTQEGLSYARAILARTAKEGE